MDTMPLKDRRFVCMVGDFEIINKSKKKQLKEKLKAPKTIIKRKTED